MDVCFGDRGSDLSDALYFLTPQQKPPKNFFPLPKEGKLSEQESEHQKIELVRGEDHGEPREEFKDKRCGVGNAQQVKDRFSDPDDGHAGEGKHGHDDDQLGGGLEAVFLFHALDEFGFGHGGFPRKCF